MWDTICLIHRYSGYIGWDWHLWGEKLYIVKSFAPLSQIKNVHTLKYNTKYIRYIIIFISFYLKLYNIIPLNYKLQTLKLFYQGFVFHQNRKKKLFRVLGKMNRLKSVLAGKSFTKLETKSAMKYLIIASLIKMHELLSVCDKIPVLSICKNNLS